MENTDNIDIKLEEIKQLLNDDIKGADLKLSIFISAANSFKRDSLLSPFPKSYQNGSGGIKDFDLLVRRRYT
jgi:hypothetical protein